jgi:hypothetical protein
MYSMLTGEQNVLMDHVLGSYHNYEFDLRPAGYSASSTSLSNMLVLESGKACLQHQFNGDYKRAEELRKLVMKDARFCIEPSGDSHVVRITGQALLSRHFAHERSGHDGAGNFHNFECYASVSIPLAQLEQGQKEHRQSHSTGGSGWTCGSDTYKCSYFLPICVIEALRAATGPMLQLPAHLNSSQSSDYPESLVSTGRGRYGGDRVPRVSSEAFEVIKHFRQHLAGKGHVSIEEIMKLEKTSPKPQPTGNDDSED